MTQPFSYYKQTDYFVVAGSFVLVIALIFLSDANPFALMLNWIAAGGFAWIISNIFKRHHLGLIDRDHSISISWALISVVLNYTLLYIKEYESTEKINTWVGVDSGLWEYLLQMGGFLIMIATAINTWTHRIDALRFIFIGILIGGISTFLNYSIAWLLLFPFIFYHMRSWSIQNAGSLFSGIVLAIWIRYFVTILVAGMAAADAFILSYSTLIDNLIPGKIDYTYWEWIFIGLIGALLIIYSISGFAINVAKTVKAHSSVVMISTLTIVLTSFAIIDLSHLPNYIGLLSIFLSFQLSIHQSCIIDAKNEWWTIAILLILAIITILPLIWMPF